MVKTFNSSGLKTAGEGTLPDLNKRCTGADCDVCDHYKGNLDRLSSSSPEYHKLLNFWDHHLNWDSPCSGKDCHTCDYIKKTVLLAQDSPKDDLERLRNLGIIDRDEAEVYRTKEFDKFTRHINSQEPEIQSFPLNYGVPRIVAGPDHPSGFIGEDPHSKYTETVAFVTDNPLHSCDRCMPVCSACGTRDTPGRIENGRHKEEFSGECRRRQQGLGFIPNYS